jgi:HAD superfamily hydrolase (TIGR01490 family)
LRAVVRSAAFFDLDKTVIAKSSALAFGRPFYKDGLISRRDMVKSAYAQLMFRIGGADEQQMARIRDHVAELCRGWRVDQVRQIVNETLDELINPYVYAEAAALIDEHRSAGRDVVVVSTSGEEMVRPIAEQLGISDVIATRMVVDDGRYTGEVAYYAAGPTKAEAARELAKERDYDLESSYAYSDSVSDVPLLEVVGHPTVVNPDRGLRRVAADRGWQVLEFRHPVPLSRRLRDRPAARSRPRSSHSASGSPSRWRSTAATAGRGGWRSRPKWSHRSQIPSLDWCPPANRRRTRGSGPRFVRTPPTATGHPRAISHGKARCFGLRPIDNEREGTPGNPVGRDGRRRLLQ